MAAIEVSKTLKDWVQALTFDNGLGFARYEGLWHGSAAASYFARPYAFWERGANENMNELLRRYFPRQTDFKPVGKGRVQCVMNRLNNRPRKTRGCRSPNELFYGVWVDLLAT